MRTDQEFIQAFKNRDNRLIQEFYKETFPMVQSMVNRNYPALKDEDVKDVFQEAVIALWTNIQEGTYRPHSDTKLTTYVLQICKFKILDKFKKKSFQNEAVLTDGMDRADDASFEYEEESEEVSRLRAVLEQMPERCRKILTLFYFEEKKLDEIALLTGIGEASIKNEKYRCMQRLKEQYSRTK